jgi:hypothetical protein
MVGASVLVLAAAVYFFTRGPARATPNPPGTFSFAVLGDAPYYPWKNPQFRLVLQSLDEHDLSWVLHVGDIFWRPCTEELYRSRLDWFNGLRHPLIYTPGDNEWTDCWEPGSGAFVPTERLDRLREIFFADPGRSLGGRPMALTSQSEQGRFAEFVENVLWVHEVVVFATVHVVGSRNGLEEFAERTFEEDAEVTRRTVAAVAWVRQAFDVAQRSNATAVVIGFHGNPAFESAREDPYRLAYDSFILALEEETERFGKPVLAVHGDDHVYFVDHPLVRRSTNARLENFTRMQVPGSPQVGWVRVTVTPGPDTKFSFESHVVPGWKYW